MKKLFFIFGLLLIGTVCFAFEVQMPLSFVYAYNHLNGTLYGKDSADAKVWETSHKYNISEIGGGLGADFFIWQNDTFGFYSRLNFYLYFLHFSDTKANDPEIYINLNLDNGPNILAFDFYLGMIKKLKTNKLEIPMAIAVVFPRVTAEEKHGGIFDFGLITDVGLRYNISNRVFVNLGGIAGIGFAFSGYSDSEIENTYDGLYGSYFLSAYTGVGFTISKNKK